MLNKKLVLAALLGAALAEDPPVESTDPPVESTDPPAEPPANPPAEEEEEDDDLPTRDWKEVMPDGSTTTVLCDQGESALWEDAKKKLVGLAAAKEATATLYTEANDEFETAEGLRNTASGDLDTFNSEAAQYETALTTAQGVVATLLADSTAAIATDSASAQTTLDGFTTATTTAQGKVTDQLARVEGLLTAQRTQELEEATWEERRLASFALQADLNTALTDAEADVTMYAQQLTTRSYLFQMAGIGVYPTNTSNTDWATGCAFGWSKQQELHGSPAGAANFDCYILEQSGADISTSVWDWSTCQSGSLPLVTAVGTVCKPKGLDPAANGDDGLLAEATTRLGSASVNPQTGLYKLFQDVNPHYHATDVKLTAHNAAITAYLAWQKKEILAEYLTIAVWTGQSSSPSVASGDYVTGTINWGDTVTYDSVTSTNWQPWINAGQVDESSTPYWYAKVKAAAVTARQTFDGWTGSAWSGNGVNLTPTLFQSYAEKLTDVWVGQWALAALNAEKGYVGATTAAGWQLDAANAVTTATTAKTDNEKNTAAMLRWKELAAAEVTAIQEDVVRARALLVALTAEVAVVTRDEFAARATLATALEEEAAKALATRTLGTAANSSTGAEATGARAVVAAAEVANASIVEQRKYHAGRLEFYENVLTPLTTKRNNAMQARDDAEAAYDAGLALLNSLRNQCKKQAFTFAQERLQKAQDEAALMQDKIAEVAAAYADTANFPAAPAIGALCNYPKGNEDPAAKRPDCGEDNCCGAAQRFLADGTKLSIETCQKPETTVYTYWPALPENALVAPTSETWRFQCISAAGRLAASVAAALATGYMLA